MYCLWITDLLLSTNDKHELFHVVNYTILKMADTELIAQIWFRSPSCLPSVVHYHDFGLDCISVVKNRIHLSEFDAVWISCDTWFLGLIISSTFLKFPWRREVIHVGMGWTIIPLDTVNLHWQKDNSNDIHLISLDRFRTCFSLTQKWIREQ